MSPRSASTWRDFVAIIVLLVIALIVGGVILANQRFSLPAGVPVLGKDFVEVEAELSTAQAVTPGQGQTVNIAGVEVGEISSVELEDGRAVVGHEDRARARDDLPRRHDPAAAEDRAEGHDGRADAGHPGGRRAGRGRADPGLADAAGRQPRRGPRLARRRHARLPEAAARRRRPGAAGQRPRAGADDPPLRADRPLRARGQRAARAAPAQPQARHPQLLAADGGAGQQGRPARRVRRELERRVRRAGQPGGEHPRDAPGAAVDARRVAGGARQGRRDGHACSGRRSRTCGRGRGRSARRCARRARS